MKTGVNGEPSNVRYGTNNVGHCFSRVMSFPDWLNALSDKEKNNFSIDSYPIQNFMLGNSETGKSEKNIFFNIPMPIHMVIKHKNQGKIESHKWFFKGFCEYMDPKFVQIIDVGSIPLWNSISYLIKHMEVNQKIGGCSGEIEVILSEKDADNKPYTFFESILLRSQYVEYKISHYLDKSFESAFGFVSVLPGAFSTFRWLAIKGDPLQKFLKGAKDEFGDMNKFFECSTANKYLAEDRGKF